MHAIEAVAEQAYCARRTDWRRCFNGNQNGKPILVVRVTHDGVGGSEGPGIAS